MDVICSTGVMGRGSTRPFSKRFPCIFMFASVLLKAMQVHLQKGKIHCCAFQIPGLIRQLATTSLGGTFMARQVSRLLCPSATGSSCHYIQHKLFHYYKVYKMYAQKQKCPFNSSANNSKGCALSEQEPPWFAFLP